MRFLGALAACLLATQGVAQAADILQTEKDKESYAVGADMARNLKGRAVEVELEPLLQGMRDVLSAGKLLMSDEDLRKTLKAWQDKIRKQQFQTRTVAPVTVAQENMAKGAAFLAQNKTNAGVVTLPSGLQYKILKAGNGRQPTATDTVEFHQKTKFIDGKEYNSTYLVGIPATLKVSEAVAGWREVLPLMPVGSKWQLFIPPHLAYGEKGVVDGRGRAKIEPNSTLICELELLAIK
jgi:FKBP-type peptidyl-prolyl cis-trans isomerase FklB